MRSIAYVIVITIAVLSSPARAMDFTGDLYGGTTFFQDETVAVDVSDGTESAGLHAKGDFEGGFMVGGRAGLLFDLEPIRLGPCLDISWTQFEVGKVDVDMFPLSILLLCHIPIPVNSEDVTPSVVLGVGPSLVIGSIDDNVVGEDTSTQAGLDARVGFRVKITDSIAFFIEYRFLYSRCEFSDAVSDEFGRLRVGTGFDVFAHCLLFGIGF